MQPYFELRDVLPFDGQTWIPLRQATETPIDPPAPTIVSLKEFTGIATAAIEDSHHAAAAKLGWSDGLDLAAHRAGVEAWGYKCADIFRDWKTPLGINLVIDQFVEEAELLIWHLHPDLVVALGLVREEDRWFRPEEGWAEVVRLEHDVKGKPIKIEIRAEYLRDYLAARGMALYCSSYHERVMVSSVKPPLPWKKGAFQEATGNDLREGIIKKAKWPHPSDHYWSRGALWRTEWVMAGAMSTRVRGDADPHISSFALTNDGSRVPATALGKSIDWLFFAPTVVLPLMRHRGAQLRWFSQETGLIGATKYGVHFGVNRLGLITVFAKDIGQLAPWEQRIWAAHNVTPEGGVSAELFAAQMEVNPASTIAPEARMEDALAALDTAFTTKHGQPLLRDHETVPSLLRRAHRFQAAEADGILELAKELTRLLAERVDVDAILKIVPLSKGEKKIGSLKALERLVAHHSTADDAKKMMAPLFGIMDLRIADAHLGTSNVASGLARAAVDAKSPAATQGRQMIVSFVDTLEAITKVLA
ncbi:MAG: hypothetical protein EP341_00275 [Sphingomonadales bacterium]|nr:MAG: hypothetical protein EP341_00275 [Sphingomonadales bacterium]